MNTSYSRHPQRGRSLRAALIIMTAAALGWTVAAVAKDEKGETKVVVKVDDKPIDRGADGAGRVSFSPVVKRVAPAVVQVNVTAEAPEVSAADLPPMLRDPRLRRFFGIPDDYQMPRAEPQHGMGSGVIVSADGYILTNNHVVQGATEIEVSLTDKRTFKAKVVGTDPESDLAVVKVDASDLPALTFADSDKIEVGDTVLAVGNPFGLGQTVTSGMVSALGRATLGLDYEDFIQTDAAINPGNSGGALVDTNGRLVGINTAILSRSGGFQGIGFAIPANLARSVMQQLATDGKVVRGYLGVTMGDLTPDMAEQFDLPKGQTGALIAEVLDDTPAEKAGLEHGDVITKIDGKTYDSMRQLRLAVADLRPGTKADFTVLRDGKEKTISVTIGNREGTTTSLAKSEDEGSLNGVGVADIDARARRQFNIPPRVEGAIITQVAPDSAAAESGLQAGDVILEINRQRVRGAEDAVKLTEQASPNGKTLVRFWNARAGVRYLIVDESK